MAFTLWSAMATPMATRKETGKRKVPSLLCKGAVTSVHLPLPHPPVLLNPGGSSQPLGGDSEGLYTGLSKACIQGALHCRLACRDLYGANVGNVPSAGQPAK